MKLTVLLSLLVLLTFGAFAALPGLIERPGAVRGPWTRPLRERESMPFPRAFENAAGERVRIARAPQRIVSGTIFSDCALLAICPAARVRALHRLSQDPRYSPVAAASARFPRHVDADAEAILAQQPDLVFLASFSREHTRALLAASGCTVVRLDRFDTVEDIAGNLRAIGWVLGLDAAAERLVEEMNSRLEAIARGAEHRRAWRCLHWAERWTSGTGTTFDSLLHWVGARNVAAEAGLREDSAPITAEMALALDPDALVVGAAPGDEAAVRARVLQDPTLRLCRAVRQEHVILVNDAFLLSTSQHVVLAAEQIAAALDRWGRP